jgi:hypothetical protein
MNGTNQFHVAGRARQMLCVKLALASIVAVVFAICLVDKSYIAEWSANR